MSLATTSFSFNYQSIFLHRSPHRLSSKLASKNGYACNFGTNRRGKPNHTIRMDLSAVSSDVVSGVSSDFHLPEWNNWFLVLVVPVVATFITAGKRGPLLKFKDQVDDALDKAEDASETIKDIAVKVDNIADLVVENLPEGKPRDAIEMMDDLAKKTIQATDKVQELLHEVGEPSDKLEEILPESEKAKPQAGTTSSKAEEEK